MIIERQQATVYKVAGKRFLTRGAAYLRAARVRVHTAYPCECDHDVGAWCGHHMLRPGETEYDDGTGYESGRIWFTRLVRRLARWYRWHDDRATQRDSADTATNEKGKAT